MTEFVVAFGKFGIRNPHRDTRAFLSHTPLHVSPQALLEPICICAQSSYPQFVLNLISDTFNRILQPAIALVNRDRISKGPNEI